MLLLALGSCLMVEPSEFVDGELEVPPPQFGFPVSDRASIYQVVGVDHDPSEQTGGIQSAICSDYEGRAFPWCYDGHDGTDFLLDGAFERMDSDSPYILAAADGEVVETHDGEYDRCHIDDFEISCDGHEIRANYVIIEHEGGWRTKYWHMMTDSVAVEVGDTVACGDVLGRIGSSGISSFPHLHFEVEDPIGVVMDPYSGPESQELSLWFDQSIPELLPEDGCVSE